jgi:hypothetical protein
VPEADRLGQLTAQDSGIGISEEDQQRSVRTVSPRAENSWSSKAEAVPGWGW